MPPYTRPTITNLEDREMSRKINFDEQITLRLPGEMVAKLDTIVESGGFVTRSQAVRTMLQSFFYEKMEE